MKRMVAMVLAVLVASAMTVSANCGKCGDEAKAGAKDKAACSNGVYACATCKTVSMTAGKCPTCKNDMTAMRCIGAKDGKAQLCPCAAGCKCTVKADDATKCSCGKDIVSVDMPAACKACKAEAPAKPAEEAK